MTIVVYYVCRTAKNTQVFEDGMQFALCDLPVQPDDQIVVPDVLFTLEGYGPATVMAVWDKGYTEPIYLVTNFDLPDEAWHCYKKRFQIETFFGDQKSRGFHLHKSHLSDPKRLARLMIAACLAYLWIVYLGITAMRTNYDKLHSSYRPFGLEHFSHGLGVSRLFPQPKFVLARLFLLAQH